MSKQSTALESFQEHDLSVIFHQDEAWLSAAGIGEALEYSTPRESVMKIYERNKEELEEYSTVVKLTTVDGKDRDMRVFNEQGVMIISMLSKQPKAIEFRRWAVQVLKEYRHQPQTIEFDSRDRKRALARLLKAHPTWWTIYRCREANLSIAETARAAKVSRAVVKHAIRDMRELGLMSRERNFPVVMGDAA